MAIHCSSKLIVTFQTNVSVTLERCHLVLFVWYLVELLQAFSCFI